MMLAMKTTSVSICEAKTHLSRYVRRVGRGERVILCRRNRPVAELRSLPPPPPRELRPIGLAKGQFTVPDDFNDPDPEFEALFYGEK